jgi:hypothetical protein
MSAIQGSNLQPVIVVEISNGLGNQMFQYAAARRLALASDAAFWLLRGDGFEERFQRRFNLETFNIAGSIIGHTSPDWAARPDARLPMVKEASIWNFIGLSQSGTRPAGPLLYVPALLTWRGSAFLSGFWQNEQYFADAADAIRADFTLKSPLDERNSACIARMQSAPSAFMHIRRGDYAEPGTHNLFGTCTLEYYSQAQQLLRDRHGAMNFFIFSDDPAWVREHRIGGPNAEIIDWNGPAPELDLILMRHCRHAVIANSTFSWWGAWLGDHPGRTTIAPKTWFKSVPEFTEIVPDRWLRL